LGSFWGQIRNVTILWEWANDILTTGEMNNKFLLGTDCDGRAAWHLAAKWGKLETLQKYGIGLK